MQFERHLIDLEAVQIKAIPIIMTLSHNDFTDKCISQVTFPASCTRLPSVGFIRYTFDRTEVMILPEHDSLSHLVD